MTHDELAAIIGPLAHRLTHSQLLELEPIAQTNPAGLAKVVTSIENDPSIDSEIGTLLSRIRRGDIPRARRQRNTPPTDNRQLAQQLYAKKIEDLHKHDLDWSEAEQRQFAIDYALDHCRASGETLWNIERDLQAEHLPGPLTGEERDFERDTPHRRLMQDTHGPAASVAKARAVEPHPTEAP